MNNIFLDFETTSHCDLKAHGLGRYLADPSTRPYMFTWRMGNMQTAELWEIGQPVPETLIVAIQNGWKFVAHNAAFDFWIWNICLRRIPEYSQLPEIQFEQVRCSAARARYNGLPGELADACEAMGLPVQKDLEGKKWMLEIAANPDWTPKSHPEHFAHTYKYGLIDTDAMHGVWHATVPMPDKYEREYQLDMRINDRGFGCDVEAAEAMEELKELAEASLDYEMALLTAGGIMAASEVAKIKEYAATFGEELDDAGREALKKIAGKEELPEQLKALIDLRLDASRAPKKSAGIIRAHVDGRIQHATVFHGALSGRSTARGAGGIQLLNTARPRPGFDNAKCEAILEAVKHRDVEFLSADGTGPILAAMADAQRQLFCATKPDHVLVGADLSGIEARMLPWIADDEAMLLEFEQGIDGYKVEAANVFQVNVDAVTKDQRQIGKVVRLALGYGGGAGAFVNMAADYGVVVAEDIVDAAVNGYRAGHPKLERLWAMLEYAALIALDQPGKEVSVPIGRGECTEIVFVRDTVALRMHLPSGRAISYHNARLHLEPGASAPQAVYDKPEGYTETLDRKILSNNATQGLARDLFWEILIDIDHPLSPVVHHVYDEVILEVLSAHATMRCDQLLVRMKQAPVWAPGLPLEAEGDVSLRWHK
jgi:DNA polymerase bacteriophage-type